MIETMKRILGVLILLAVPAFRFIGKGGEGIKLPILLEALMIGTGFDWAFPKFRERLLSKDTARTPQEPLG